jgi:signal transduction histidine kinase
MDIARALRFAGYPLVFAVGEPLWVQPFSSDQHLVGSTRFPTWAAAYAVFAVAFHLGASTPESARLRRLSILGVMTCATLTMAALIDCDFGSLSFVVLASQAALFLPRRHTALFVAAQTVVLGCLVAHWVEAGLSHLVGLIAAVIFAAVAVHLARHVAETAKNLAHANAELRATRSLLEETCRAHERTRISRELHDVLGHDLTALGLQLEIATHVEGDLAKVHLGKAQAVTERLLSNVRDVVGAIRADAGADVVPPLRALVRDVPGLNVHLDAPGALLVEDPARAQCVLRCVQEIITNALRHAHAQNLWIRVERAGDEISVDARDDGRGAESVRAGMGLRGMRDRLEEMGGLLQIATAKERAFSVVARLPLRGRGAT